MNWMKDLYEVLTWWEIVIFSIGAVFSVLNSLLAVLYCLGFIWTQGITVCCERLIARDRVYYYTFMKKELTVAPPKFMDGKDLSELEVWLYQQYIHYERFGHLPYYK